MRVDVSGVVAPPGGQRGEPGGGVEGEGGRVVGPGLACELVDLFLDYLR